MQKPSSAFSEQVPQEWHREADVVIAGYGGAGAAAAIEAHDAEAEVLVVESSEKGGGNTLVSFGGFLCPTDAEGAKIYISRLFDFSFSEKDDSLIQTFCEESVKNIDWLKGLKEDVKIHAYGGAGFPEVAGAPAIKKYIIDGKEKGATAFAKHLFGLLSFAVEEKRGIQVMTRTRAKRLVTGHKGEVVGILAERNGEIFAIRAKRAVVLATGGYEADSQMLQNHVKGFPIYFLGHTGNRGDGIRMAQKAGADLWHMNGVSCCFGIKTPESESAFGIRLSHPAHIFVDKHGKRFVNETEIEIHAGLLAVDFFDANALEYPRIPFYAIFDESLRQAGRISIMSGLGAAGSEYEWSRGNAAEIKKGWIIKGKTVDQLAEKLQIDPKNLKETVSQWNTDAGNKEDKQFGRKDIDGAIPGSIKDPPFYALEIYPCLINTQGGPRRNAKAQVMDAFGKPIPGLYSAGELGSMWGLIYQGGGNIAECMVFGRIAGRNAAAEKSR